ncbi:MAG: fimbria major subunit, partial [Alistipes sp.]|nr:fimbria major subunit [Alistipes sp.]
IVRNHIYDININSIGGYGSPIYTGVEFNEYPAISDQQSFVSAKINILSWRLVSQSVDIQPQN